MNLLLRPVSSSIGRKYVMAVTGFLLLVFVFAHMAGNLIIYAGRDALNSYAAGLQSNLALLWAVRLGLLITFVVHLSVGYMLTKQNEAARPTGYVVDRAIVSSWFSRHMMSTGLLVLAFVIYHLAHFTLGVVHDVPGTDRSLRALTDGKGRHDVYGMVVIGFRILPVTLSYLAAQVFLYMHLHHGASSWFQSIGWNHPRYNGYFRAFGPVFAAVIFIGNCSIPLAVYFGLVGTVP
jgi:succinate dehydrogenase / fumarate reductase cytochrome b subunit